MSTTPSLAPALASLPAGPCAIALSAGADSTALFHLLRQHRPDIQLHVVHLDHQTRGPDSTADADLVAHLARTFNLPCIIARRDEIEPALPRLPKNPSARYRAVRLELFRQTVAAHNLCGVLLAQHADDQAETVLLRLLRGSGPIGLTGMAPRSQIGSLTLFRPLLKIRRQQLRDFLLSHGQSWREDASNQSPRYARNRVRKFLAANPDLFDRAMQLAAASASYVRWLKKSAPELPDKFPAIGLAVFPRALARQSARRWLARRGLPPSELSNEVLDRLRLMATDAASPARQLFPGNLTIHRRRGWISLD